MPNICNLNRMKVYNIILIGFAALVLLAMLHQIHLVSESFETNCTPNGTMLGRPSPDNRIRLYTQDECNLLNGNWYSNGECLKKSGGSYSAECSVLNAQVVSNVCTPNGIMLGRPSPDNTIRVYTQDECNLLNGNWYSNGECLKKGGGSYSAECSSLNVQAPVDAPVAAPLPVAVPVASPVAAPLPVPVQRSPAPVQRSPVAVQRSPVPVKRSPKRSSPKRKSPKRSSPKRKSPKRSSPKRKSPKRSSSKRSSSKRRSPKRKMSYSKELQPYNKDHLPSVDDHPATKRLPSTKSRKHPTARELGPQIAIYL